MSKLETVLIVEDEALIALDLEFAIREMGFDVAAASSVPEALAIVAAQPIHFAILDFKVGQHDTTELADQLTQRNVPFAVCSGSDIETARRVFSGAPFIPKPYSQDVLRTTIEAALN